MTAAESPVPSIRILDRVDDERPALRSLLAGSSLPRLRLPESLELAYREYHYGVALAQVRAYWPVVVLAVAAIGMLLFVPGLVAPDLHDLVLRGFLVMYIVIGIVVAAALIKPLQPYLALMVGVAAISGLGAMHVATTVVGHDSSLHTIAEFGVILVTLAVFTISNLLFAQAVFCVLAATGAFIVLALIGNLPVDRLEFPVYVLGSALVGAIAGFGQEIRERTVFLQGRLLLLEKREIDLLALELEKLSRIDALTGLANRRRFDEHLDREWATCMREREPVSLLFIDVDYFKRYNDHYGHQAGDTCLSRVGRTLGEQSTRAGDLMARYGGEEFVALFPRTGREGASVVAQRILRAIDELRMPHAMSDVEPHVTVSIGIASITPVDDTRPADLVRAADEALYLAKQAGRHRCVAATGPAE